MVYFHVKKKIEKKFVTFFYFTVPQSCCGYICTSDMKGFVDTTNVRDQLRIYL